MTATTIDPNLANNSATVTSLTATQADLSATQTTAAGPVLAGNTITYTVTFVERRPQRRPDRGARRTSCRPTRPSSPTPRLRDRRSRSHARRHGTITGTIATLPAGASASFTLVVLVLPSTPAGTTITNTA